MILLFKVEGRGWGIHISLVAILEGIHISLVICVRGYTYHGDTHITVTGLPAKLTWVQLRRQAGSRRRLSAMKIFYVNTIWTICGPNVWRNNSIFSHNPILYRWNCRKLRQFDLHFTPIWVRRRSIADGPGTHWNRSPNVALALATGDYVASR